MLSMSLLGARALLGASLLLSGLFAQSADDRQFLENAFRSGDRELKMAQHAIQHSTDEAVKQYAQRLVEDRSKLQQELGELAKTKGITLQADNAKTPEKAADKSTFAKQMATHQEKELAAFEKASRSTGDKEIKEWAYSKLATLRSHLSEAKALLK